MGRWRPPEASAFQMQQLTSDYRPHQVLQALLREPLTCDAPRTGLHRRARLPRVCFAFLSLVCAGCCPKHSTQESLRWGLSGSSPGLILTVAKRHTTDYFSNVRRDIFDVLLLSAT